MTAVLVERHGAVAEVVLNRPARRNALSRESITALADSFGALAGPDVGAVVIRGAGGFFCSGLDTGEIDAADPPLTSWIAVHEAIRGIEAPVIACLVGGAINAGAALALAADLLVAGTASYLQVAEAAMGIAAPLNLAWLAERHPAGVGLQIALTARRFTGPDLHRLGIALDLVADEDAPRHARALAEQLAGYPAGAVAGAKRGLGAARRAGGFAHAVGATPAGSTT